ncbi:hypothetical protein ACJJTC_004503 [Scirpophaga incertulas]
MPLRLLASSPRWVHCTFGRGRYLPAVPVPYAGVPQGSYLSPCLSAAYTDEMPRSNGNESPQMSSGTPRAPPGDMRGIRRLDERLNVLRECPPRLCTAYKYCLVTVIMCLP